MYYILEEWKAIEGYDDYYEISNYGRVKSLERQVPHASRKSGLQMVPARILKAAIGKNGYLHVALSKSDVKQSLNIHRLVLKAFVGPCPKGKECRHLDGDSENNFMWNLTWGTPKENCRDKTKHGTQNSGEKNGASALTKSQVFEIHRLGSETNLLHREIGVMFGVRRQAVGEILNGQRWKHIYKEFHEE